MKCIKINLTDSEYAKSANLAIQDKIANILMSSGNQKIAMFADNNKVSGHSIYLIPHDNDVLTAISRAYQSEISELPDISLLKSMAGSSAAIL